MYQLAESHHRPNAQETDIDLRICPMAMTHIANCIRRPDDREDVYIGGETLTAVSCSSGLPLSVDRDRLSPRPNSRSSTRGSVTSPKYQLWPVSPPPPQKSPFALSPVSYFKSFLGPDSKAMALAVGRSSTSLSDTAIPHESSKPLWPRQRPSELSRRRKVNIPELSGAAPMATVQEGLLDSPTIPGRPPLRRLASDISMSTTHGRSSSVPGTGWRANPFSDALVSCVTGPAPYERASNTNYVPPPMTARSVRPLSPILSPATAAPPRPTLKLDTTARATQQRDDIPPIPPPKSPSTERKRSPNSKQQPQSARPAITTPILTTPISGPQSARPAMTSSSDISAPMIAPASALALETTVSPKFAILAVAAQPTVPRSASALGSRDWPNISPPLDSIESAAHSRTASETSIMSRGRPPKRALSRQRSQTASELRVTPPSEPWQLPVGTRPAEATKVYKESDVSGLRRQAVEQAEKFEVISKKDVASLSRELRALDERCEYLRKTYRSLREGRQKLHSRMLSYLKRNDTVIFSRESLLKQEEALSELDISIDDWIAKLEQAENRRMRVRQKLLEHVAAALIIDAPDAGINHVVNNTATPPRSPIKADSPSATERELRTRSDTESIKIYADGRVLNLFADIEQAIGEMCEDH